MRLSTVSVMRTAGVLLIAGVLAACPPPPEAPAEVPEDSGETPVAEAVPEGELTPDAIEAFFASVVDPRQFAECNIFIKIAGNSGNHRWVVAPRSCQVCKNPKVDCKDTATFRWVGQDTGATVHVERKTGEPDCFDPVDLTSPPDKQTEMVKSECPADWEWEYEVSCEDGDSDNCPPAALDPTVIIRE